MFNQLKTSASTTLPLNARSHVKEGGHRFTLSRKAKPAKPASSPASPDTENIRKAIARAQRGDEQAFAELYHTYSRRVYSLCLRMTHDEVEAEDLTQEAFLHLFRKLDSFRGESAFGTWLHRLVVNVVLMRLRKKTLRMVSLEETSPEPGAEEAGRRDFAVRQYGREDRQLASAVDRVTLDRAIRELPAGYRAILLLHDLEGYEHSEIARLRKCSVGNSKSQLHKARVKLRQLLRRGPAARRVALRAFASLVYGVQTGSQNFGSRLRAARRQVHPVTS